MRKNVPGPKRQRLLVAEGVGYKAKDKGMRRRKFLRGREIAPDIVQINTKVVGYGDKTIEEILGGGEEGETSEE
jgi:small subunit ribosomal protein S6e